MTPYEAMLLGLLQGLTEFLPVSSSGHLALGQAAWGIQTGNVTFEVIVHFGTLLAIVTALRARITHLVAGCLQRDGASWHTICLLMVGSIPAGVVGILFKDMLKAAFASPVAVCGFLIATGCILWSTRFARGDRVKITFLDAILIGFAQALARITGDFQIGFNHWHGPVARAGWPRSRNIFFFIIHPHYFGRNRIRSWRFARPSAANGGSMASADWCCCGLYIRRICNSMAPGLAHWRAFCTICLLLLAHRPGGHSVFWKVNNP